MAGMSIPWQAFPIALVGIAIAVVVRNSMKMRRRLGDNATPEDIQNVYPNAKTFTIKHGKPEE
jgi:hypothetical protein